MGFGFIWRMRRGWRAQRYIHMLEDALEMLGRMPEAGKAHRELEAQVRSFPVGNDLIYYRPRSRGGVAIVRIIHGARDQGAAFD